MRGKRTPPEKVVVRKYGNRRLYRTDESRYVTLEELAELVRDDVDFEVHDARTDEDLTAVVLAQVILEEEKRSKGTFPQALLRQIIRLHDERLVGFLVDHLPRLTAIYMEATEATSETLDIAASSVGTGEAAIIAQLASVHSQLSQLLASLEVEE